MEKLKIVAIAFVYNEINFIDYKRQWAEEQDIELYIIDNMSNDGTWEYLQEKGIPSHRFNTNSGFHLVSLQQELIKTLHQIQPDWFVYHGCDTFYYTKNGLRNDIELANQQGHDALGLMGISIKNTGEVVPKNMSIFHVYQHGEITKNFFQVGKYTPTVKIHGDNIKCQNGKTIPSGVIINYGMTKSAKDREETLRRRKIAWRDGLRKDFGGHYRQASIKKWIWKKTELKNIAINNYGYVLEILKKYKQNDFWGKKQNGY